MWLLFALGAAISFGLRGLLYQWTSQQSLNRNLMLFGVYVTGLIVSFTVSLIAGQTWTVGSLAGIAMGTFSFVANGAMYKGYAVGKASVVAILTALPPVINVLIAFLLWGESLSIAQLLCFFLIMSGILLIRYASKPSFDQLKGIHWAIIAMLCFSVTDLSSKQSTVWGADVFPTLSMMFLTGSILFSIAWLRNVQRDRQTKEPSRQWSRPRTFLWGLIVGMTNVTGMIFLLYALTNGITGLVTAVQATNVLVVLIYARVHLKERFRLLELSGMLFSFIGLLLLFTL